MKKMMWMAILALFAAGSVCGGTITVTQPAGGDVAMGAACPIAWTASGITSNVRINLITPGGALVGNIAGNQAPDSSPYNWTVGAPAVVGERYRVRVAATDGSGMGESAIFTVVAGGGGPGDPEDPEDPGTRGTIGNVRLGGTSPYKIGNSVTVSWTATGVGQNLKLQLIRSGGGLVGPIVNNLAAGTSSHLWTAGSYIGGTAEAADNAYRIRVSTLDNSLTAESAVFSLTNFTIAEVVALPDLIVNPRCDLELAGVGVEYDGTRIVAWVKNNGPDALVNREVKFRLNFPERGGGEQILTREITIPVGQERSVPMVVMDASVFPDSGLRTSVSVDTGLSRIHDPNRLNQHRDVRLCVLDIRCSMDNLHLSKVYSYVYRNLPFKVTYSIHVRHNLPRPVNNIRVRAEYRGPAGLLAGHGNTVSYTIPALATGEVWTRNMEMRFGEAGESGDTGQPRISEGTTYRIVFAIDDPRNAFCDTTPANDAAELTFRFPD